ncbi:MAG: NADPH-dependent FMN reductase [Rhodospirillales bacterium]
MNAATLNVLALSGSLRKGSYNTMLIEAAKGLAPAGMKIDIASIRDIPLYDEDVRSEAVPASVKTLAQKIRDADAVLISTPEYNYSIPGVLKNAIDWLSREEKQPFDGKPIAIMGASMGKLGTARSQYHLRQVFVFLNGLVMNRPEVFLGAAHEAFNDDGTLKDEGTKKFLGQMLEALRDWARKQG